MYHWAWSNIVAAVWIAVVVSMAVSINHWTWSRTVHVVWSWLSVVRSTVTILWACCWCHVVARMCSLSVRASVHLVARSVHTVVVILSVSCASHHYHGDHAEESLFHNCEFCFMC